MTTSYFYYYFAETTKAPIKKIVNITPIVIGVMCFLVIFIFVTQILLAFFYPFKTAPKKIPAHVEHFGNQ